MAKKELFTNRKSIFGLWIRMWAGFRSTVKTGRQKPLSILCQYAEKSQPFLIMFLSGSRHSQDVKGGVAIIAKMAKVRIMPVTYTGPRDLKGLATVNVLIWTLDIPLIFRILKRWMTKGVAEVARRSKRSLIAWCGSTSDQHPNKTLLSWFAC